MAKRRKKKNKRKQADVAIVSLIIISILLIILIYTNAGYMGQYINPILSGLMGGIKYILPLGTFAVAILLACDNKEFFKAKVFQYTVVLLCIANSMTVYQISTGNLNVDNNFETVIQEAYSLGEKNMGGGAIGALVAVPLAKLLGKFGAVVLSIGIATVLVMFILGIQPSELLAEYIEDFKERKKERMNEKYEEEEELDQRAEERLNARKQAREERRLAREREKEERAARKAAMIQNSLEATEDQMTINLNERAPKKSKKSITQIANDITGNSEPISNENNSLFEKKEEEKEDKTKEVLNLEHQTLIMEDENYITPPIELLQEGTSRVVKGGKKAVTETATKLQKTLYSFGVSAKVENVSVGPAITRYELKPAEGVRVSKIANLADDIALNLKAESIRIEAPIPGKQAVGIEIPNTENETVHLRDILESDDFVDAKSKLSVGLGKDVSGQAVVTDIAKMPHVLVAGSTGSGKSVCINTLITSIIYKAKPSEVKLVMVDPKIVELSVYNGIPHLLIPVVTDPKKAAGALAWAVQEMENRYASFAEKGARNIEGYNEALKEEEGAGKLPHIVIIIDELADLMMVAKNDVEDAICRLAQKARAAGMHLVIATQRPSVDVITGLIKANIPSRIAFAVSSQVDSRTILDMAGAEKLLGKGDMLFYPTGVPKPMRIQGAFVSDKEVENIVAFLKSNGGEVTYSEDIIQSIENANKSDKELKEQADEDDETDPFLMDAIETVVETGTASTSFIQRKFKVGYARAGRIMDQMEERGIISGYEGSKPRQVLMTVERLAELKMASKGESAE